MTTAPQLGPAPHRQARLRSEPEALALSIDDLVRAMGLSRSFLYAEMAAGRLRYIKAGKRRLVTHEGATQYLRDREAEQAAL